MANQDQGKTIVFVHGAWVTSSCWSHFVSYFESLGYHCLAPNWPFKEKTVQEQQEKPDSNLATLGVTEIVNYYEKIIRELDEPPILIGHSFGGLFVEMLLDRGCGSMGVAIDPAPAKGIFSFYPSVLKSLSPIFLTFKGWKKIIPRNLQSFSYAFIHKLPPNEQREVFEQYVVPETGRIFFQGLTSPLTNTLRVNFSNSNRSPLLLISGSDDHVCPNAQTKETYQKYQQSKAVTDFKEFEGRTHWIIAQTGWEEVAEFISKWVLSHSKKS